MVSITKKEAGKFILMKQGLYGPYKFIGKTGIMEYIKQAGCIQYDPIDICGKNHELVLQSRVGNFEKPYLYELLYQERRLFDYFDKMMAIMEIEDWPYFDGTREYNCNNGRGKEEVDKTSACILDFIDKNGPVCSSDIEHDGTVIGYWGRPTRLSRIALETLYFRGELIIHHKKNTRKYYDLAQKHVPDEILNIHNPNGTTEKQHDWHLLRRIQSAGALWNRRSDALLGISGFKTPQRNASFQHLLSKGHIIEIKVEDMKFPLYILSGDEVLLKQSLENNIKSSRTEFIAPLDNMMWDRKLIEEIFGFSYKWEIYTPAKDRKYGYYVLPLLYGDNLAGRVEIKKSSVTRKQEIVNLWLEEGIRETKKLNESLIRRLKKFNKFYNS
ncbi:MAG: YcaQ family DNA glycosylase [Clostridiales bacterium]|nr:YcaQ family DNA glycosylase [Clostridiales bacterium]